MAASPAQPGVDWHAAPEFEAALSELGWPRQEIAESAFEATASAGRAATALLALPGRTERLHLRRIQHGGWLGPLWRGTLWGSQRPLAEWDVHTRLWAAGAPVPQPALVACWRRHGPFHTAIYGTVHVEDARDGVAWLETEPRPDPLLRAARAAGAAIRRFHDLGGAHADLHLKNLLFRETGPAVRAWVIDLDGARAGTPPAPARRMQELMRLARSLTKRGVADQVGVRGCAAAFGAYCAGDRTLRSQLLLQLPAEQRRNARHARFYRADASGA